MPSLDKAEFGCFDQALYTYAPVVHRGLLMAPPQTVVLLQRQRGGESPCVSLRMMDKHGP